MMGPNGDEARKDPALCRSGFLVELSESFVKLHPGRELRFTIDIDLG